MYVKNNIIGSLEFYMASVTMEFKQNIIIFCKFNDTNETLSCGRDMKNK